MLRRLDREHRMLMDNSGEWDVPAPVPTTAERDESRSRRIAVVALTDEARRSALAAVLRSEGMVAVEVEDGLELEDYLELSALPSSRIEAPALIVCETELPGRSGLEIVQRLRELGTPVPLILIDSGGRKRRASQPPETLGAACVLFEPLDEEELREVVDLFA